MYVVLWVGTHAQRPRHRCSLCSVKNRISMAGFCSLICENQWKQAGWHHIHSSYCSRECLCSPFKVMNMYAFPFNHYLRPGSWICFAVRTNCWGLRSGVECVDIFASEALIQKGRNWKHLGVVIVWNFNMRVVPFTKACDISFSV